MADHPLSKSEIFFYGALARLLSPLIQELDPKSKDESYSAAEESLTEWFPTFREAWPKVVEPFSAIEQLSIELGLARRVELEPAGDDEENPLDPEVHQRPPLDTEWAFADGQPLRVGEFDEVIAQLAQARDEAFADNDGLIDQPFSVKWMQRAGDMIDLLSGVPQWIPMSLRQACFKELIASMGPFVVQGCSPSLPGYVYRISWRGDTYRYRVPRQDNHFYQAIIERFEDELEIPTLARWSLGRSTKSLPRPLDALATAAKSKSPRLALWLKSLRDQFGQDSEWLLADQLAFSQFTARILENRVTSEEKEIGALAAREAQARLMSTRERLDEFVSYISITLDERASDFDEGKRDLDKPLPEERLVGGLRFLCSQVKDGLRSSAECATSTGLHEVAAVARSGAGFATWFDYSIKSLPAGLTSATEVRRGCSHLSHAASDAMKLAYGQLYFRELTNQQIYIDPATQLKLLREPKAVREQLAESIKQYERQTLPNCSVTSACGLVEPTVRKMAAAWLQPGTYRGDTAAVLKALLDATLMELNRIREKSPADGNPSPEEADALLRLFCINVAFGLNHLGNTVRHHASKTLKRHDAGVMLHGLCAILQRL